MKPEEIELLLSELEQAFKRGSVDICPSCKGITKVRPNPMYMHECHCGWKGNYDLCEFKHPKDFAREVLMRYFSQIV